MKRHKAIEGLTKQDTELLIDIRALLAIIADGITATSKLELSEARQVFLKFVKEPDE